MVRIIRKKNYARLLIGVLFSLGILTGYGYWSIHRPLPLLQPQQVKQTLQLKAPTGSLTWPAQQSAVGVIDGSDYNADPAIETHGTQTSVPTASTAKMLTALMIIEKKPLRSTEQGPSITITTDDVARYEANKAADGSGIPVQAGEQLSEYQMLQAILLPSANNIADTLAIWAYGSLDNYATFANVYLERLGLHDTHIGKDASGLDPSTTSTAHDLVILGKHLMGDPVLASIVGQQTATNIPLVGTIKNVNFLLGNSSIIGIKTGNSDQAGGVYVSASQTTVNGRPVTIVTALMGAPNLYDAVQGSLGLIHSAQANFKVVDVVHADQDLGSYRLPWGGTVEAMASESLGYSAWAGSTVPAKITLRAIKASSRVNANVGSVSSGEQKSFIKLKQSIPQPSTWWRLTHPLN
jgi:D-alanyl-D-alanine carboxypeptidase (penicillin-binding protein 5/6)